MLPITRHEAMVDRVRQNFYAKRTLKESAADIGVSYQTLRIMERELGLRRPHQGLRPGSRRHRSGSTARNTIWEGSFFIVINLCRTYCIVTKRSRNPRYEVAQRMPIQEIVFEARGETVTELIAMAQEWDREEIQKQRIMNNE